MVKMTIGEFATLCLKKGLGAKETLEKVKKVFPNSKTSIKCIYFYASKAKVKLTQAQVVDAKELEMAMEELAA